MRCLHCERPLPCGGHEDRIVLVVARSHANLIGDLRDLMCPIGVRVVENRRRDPTLWPRRGQPAFFA
jgi:hypothetical protein